MENKIVINVYQKTSRLKQSLRKCKCCVTEREEARKVVWISNIPSSLRMLLSMAEIQASEVSLLPSVLVVMVTLMTSQQIILFY